MATFTGGPGNDTYNGTSDDDQATGGGGNDTLRGNDGNDLLEGGAGIDTLIGGNGNDFLASYQADANFTQYPYEDSISLDNYAGADTLQGGDGDDYIAAGYGDNVDGGTGSNTLYISFLGATSGVHADFSKLYGGGSITIGGGVIKNISQTPTIEGSNFDDYIVPLSDGYAFNKIYGNGGNDHIIGDSQTTLVDGGAGDDTIDVRGSEYGPKVYGGDGNDTLIGGNNAPSLYGDAGDDNITNSGLIEGGTGNDTIVSQFSYYDNRAFGDDGNDTISGSADFANNYFYGGTGSDHIDGNSGDDHLYSDGETGYDPNNGLTGTDDHGLEQDTLIGGAGNDTLNIGYGDNADGGDGTDTLTLVWDPAAAGFTLNTAAIIGGHPYHFGAGIIQNIELIDTLYATDHNDVVHVAVQDGTVTVYGEGGDDQLFGGGSAVHLLGGAGDDKLVAKAGGDVLEGGTGNDLFLINGAGEIVVENPGEGTDKVQSTISYTLGANVEQLVLTGGGNLSGTGNELGNLINGAGGANVLSGLDGDDKLYGKGGDDKLVGGNGNDLLNGGVGNDNLSGGAGADKLVGGAGADTLTGGADADRFQFVSVADFGGATLATADRITDFSQAQHDVIELTRIDAVAGGTDDPFAWMGTAAFDGHAGELRYEQSGSDTLVTGDLNGDGTADFMIALTGLYTLTAGDFAL